MHSPLVGPNFSSARSLLGSSITSIHYCTPNPLLPLRQLLVICLLYPLLSAMFHCLNAFLALSNFFWGSSSPFSLSSIARACFFCATVSSSIIFAQWPSLTLVWSPASAIGLKAERSSRFSVPRGWVSFNTYKDCASGDNGGIRFEGEASVELSNDAKVADSLSLPAYRPPALTTHNINW